MESTNQVEIERMLEHCIKLACIYAPEHKLLAHRFFGRAEALFAIVGLLKNDDSTLLNGLIGVPSHE
jgi:hypothetical protein